MNPIDQIIVCVYVLAMVAVGIACRGRQESVDDYFTTRGGMSGFWGTLLVGLSLAATLFSGTSFIAFPSITFDYGLRTLVFLATFPACYFVLRYWFLPRYLTAGYTHPYDVVEESFGRPVRITASWIFVLLRLGWMATLIYAPSLLILAAFHLPESWTWPVILIVGILSTIYTVFGGIRGVIVTDAIQMLVIMAGIATSVGFIFYKLDLPLPEITATLSASNHLEWADLSLSPKAPFTLAAILIGVSIANLASYVGDQMSLQRYLATGTVKAASRSFLINICGASIVIFLLFLVGMSLVVWFAHHPVPELLNADGKMMSDKVFPYFVSYHLPTGLSGLLIAAILAATMSSLTSGINAVSGALCGDILSSRLARLKPRGQLAVARWLSVVIGLFATVAAGFVPLLGTFYEATQLLLGLFAGPLLACVILSVLKVSAPAWSILAGMIVGVAAGAIAWGLEFYSLWTSPVTFSATILVAAIGWSLFPTTSTSPPSRQITP